MDEPWTERARRRMQALGVTQQNLAQALQCSRGAVGHYLSGRRNPSIDQFQVIAEVLGMGLLQLIQGSGQVGVRDGDGATVPVTVPVLGDSTRGMRRRGSARTTLPLGSGLCYGFRIAGGEYSPRYYPGEVALIDPAATVRPGDEVLVELGNGEARLHAVVSMKEDRVTLDHIAGDRRRITLELRELRFMHRVAAVIRPE